MMNGIKSKKEVFSVVFFQKYLKSYLSFIPFFFPNHMTHFFMNNLEINQYIDNKTSRKISNNNNNVNELLKKI